MKFSLIIPVSEKDTHLLRRCITHIKDQDYEEKEIIVVGHKNKEAQVITEDEKATFVEARTDTAPVKRNDGFDASKGEIVFFFDVDCMLLPGMLRLLKDTFEDNPDCDFIYGAYRWNTESLNTFPSRPFDPYLLSVMNYISTMSPMKREIFPRFNEDLEYFQDWDLFLRITDKGHKGHFLPDVIFITEVTDAKSISGNQKVEFYQKIKTIKQLNKVPLRKICVTSLGAAHQSIQRAKVLEADYIGCHRGSSLIQTPAMYENRYGMIYVMGFYPITIKDHAALFANSRKDCLKVIQWIGTDVHQMRTRFNWETIKYLRENVYKHIDVQLCNSLHLRTELAEMGFNAHVVHMPLCEEIKPSPLPKKFTVGVYYSDTNPMHNEVFMMDVAKSMPDIDFIFFGGSKQAKEENIEYVPFTNINDIIARCSMNLRITVHDGFPHTPIHFMLAGRQVITNVDMPYSNFMDINIDNETYGESKVAVIEKIRAVRTGKEGGDLDEAKGYYIELMDPVKYKNIIYDILKRGKHYIFSDERFHIHRPEDIICPEEK